MGIAPHLALLAPLTAPRTAYLVRGWGMALRDLLLSARVIAINAAVFAVGTGVLAFSPATVSSQPVLSEALVLVIGGVVLIAANAWLVRHTLRPLDSLSAQLDRAAPDPESRVSVTDDAISRPLSLAVNDLLARIDAAHRAADIAALTAQESERSRVAQELHDGVGQTLTACLLQLELLARSGAQGDGAAHEAALVDVRESVRGALDEVRRVARSLRPHVLEDLGLKSALAALTRDLFEHTDVHVHRGIAPGLPELDDAAELVVFRVAQEALTNVARHADARTVRLTLSAVGDDVRLEATDDGRGLGRAPAGTADSEGTADTEGTGVRGMRERASLIGGRLDLGPAEGGGTTVMLTVPTHG